MKRYIVLMIAVLMLGAVACSGESQQEDAAERVSEEKVEATETVTGELADIRLDRFSSGRSYTLLHVVTDDNTDHYFGMYGWEGLLKQGQSLKLAHDKDERSLLNTVETKHNSDGSVSFVEIVWIRVELTDITILPS